MNRLLALLNSLHPENDYVNSTDFVMEGLLDSLDIVTLVSMLEVEFGIFVAGDEVVPENFRDLASLDAFINRCPRSPCLL